jgi:hypothetical protein
VLVVGGGLLGLLLARSFGAERARLNGLAPSSAAAVTDAPVGREVLLEGRVATSQPAVFRNFVAFMRQQREERRRSGDSTKSWQTQERRTPPLLVDLPDGSVRVVNTTYDIRNAVTSWEDPQVVDRMETRYTGLVAGEEVLVVGRAAWGGVEAEYVVSGDRQSYRASLATGRVVALVVGGVAAAVGLLLVAKSGFLRFGGLAPAGRRR